MSGVGTWLLTLSAAALPVLLGYWLTKRKVAEIHVLVNSRLTAVLNRVDQLTDSLLAAGVDIPEDPDPQDKK